MALGKKKGNRKAGRDSLAYYLPTSNVATVCETMDEVPPLVVNEDGETLYCVVECDARALGFNGRASSSDHAWGELVADIDTGTIVSVVTDELIAQEHFLVCPTRLTLEALADQQCFAAGPSGAKVNLALMDGEGKVVRRAAAPVALADLTAAVAADEAGSVARLAGLAEGAPDVADRPTEAFAAQADVAEAWDDDEDAGVWDPDDDDEEGFDLFVDGDVPAGDIADGADPFADVASPFADVPQDPFALFGEAPEGPAEPAVPEPEADLPEGGDGVYEVGEDGEVAEAGQAPDVVATLVGDGTFSVAISPAEADRLLASVIGGGPEASVELSMPLDLERPSAGYVAPLVRYYERELRGLAEKQWAETKLLFWNTLTAEADEAERRAREKRDRYVEDRQADLARAADERAAAAAADVQAQLEKAKKDRATYVANATRAAEAEWDANFAGKFDAVVEKIRNRAEVADADDRMKVDARSKEVYRDELKAGVDLARQHALDAAVALWRRDAARIDRLRLNAIEAVAEKTEEAKPYDDLAARHTLLQDQMRRLQEETAATIAEERARANHAIEDGRSNADNMVASARQRADAEAERLKGEVAERDARIRTLEDRARTLQADADRVAKEQRELAEAQASTYRDQLDRSTRQLEELREASVRRTLWAVAGTILVCIMVLVAVFAVVSMTL